MAAHSLKPGLMRTFGGKERMNITIKCPNCNAQVAHTNAFCTFCGVSLNRTDAVAKPFVAAHEESAAAPEAPAVRAAAKRTCPKGHTFTDASLRYCPVCALPFDEDPSVVAGSVWACGHHNTPATLFCTTCGIRKGSTPRRDPAPAPATPAPSASSGYGSIPFGLRPPTDDDLMRK